MAEIEIEMDKDLLNKIESLVERGEFKSIDDFIELASHEFVLRRFPRNP